MTEQLSFASDLFASGQRHTSCRGCYHTYPIYSYTESIEDAHVEYACAIPGVSPKGSPRYARGCPDDMPDMYQKGWRP